MAARTSEFILQALNSRDKTWWQETNGKEPNAKRKKKEGWQDGSPNGQWFVQSHHHKLLTFSQAKREKSSFI